MLERDGYLPGVPCWVDTSQPDPEAAVAFYNGLFGWEFEDTMPAGSTARYFIARLRGGDVAAVGSLPQDGPGRAVWNTYVWVESADAAAAKVRGAGGRVVTDPFDVMDAGRMAVVMDPEGAAFCVWQARRHKGAQIVNEPGSLNFNGLNTRDVEGAKSFYRSVFGWETLGVGGGVEIGGWPATASSWRAAIPSCSSGRPTAARRPRASQTLSRRSIRSPMTSPKSPRTGA